MMWLGIFGAFVGGVLKGWIGEGRGSSKKLDKLTPKDSATDRARAARDRIKVSER